MLSKVMTIKNHKATFYTVLGAIILSFGFYMFLINATVRNVLSTKDIEMELSQLRNNVAELEYRYISKRSDFTIEQASYLGLHELKNKIFISKTGTSRSLSLNDR